MKSSLFHLLAISVFIFAQLPAVSQEVKWNNAPQKGFVFEISNKEAQKLLSGSRAAGITDDLLHTLIDSFDVQKGWTKRPAKGHFIMAKIIGTKLHCEYTCVFPYQVFLLREYNAMSLQVLDLDGNVRNDARVKLGFRRLRTDPESKTYRIENDGFTSEDQNVTVELYGFRSVFNIQKHEVPTWYNNSDEDEGPSFYSYLITDKNKYKPNERVRFKSFALSHVKSPLKKELEIWLYAYPKRIRLGNIDPHRPGSYAGEFLLHDSLKLELDKNYNLQLCEKNGRQVASCSFRYEDYELSGNKLELKIDKTRHYFPEKNQITITATDANDLILKDAKADILIQPYTILETIQPFVILPDTLFFIHMDLDPEKPTVVDIPWELFQKTNSTYQVSVTVRNSQNQRMERKQMASFYYSGYELTTRFSNDTICFGILKNNVPVDNMPMVMTINNDINARQIFLPYKEKLNAANRLFHFENEFIKRDILLNSLNPEVKLAGGIQIDSFNIRLVNPHKLEVSWYVYQGTRLLTKGFGSDFEYKSLIEDRTQTFYVELLYSFGGQDQAIRRQFEFREDYLNVSLEIPERVYPGQQVAATISVNDQSGQPVRNVDLTAMAVTGKLDYYIPDLPYYGASSSPRPKGATYSKKDLNEQEAILELDYKKWERIARLDTMVFFQFMYPGSSGFARTVNNTDSTQFAVYVMKKGTARQIHVIELDRHPVYYSWTNQPKGYSFYVSPTGKHEITLRLFDRVLVLDSMAFTKGKKAIISVDLENLPAGTKVFMMEDKFSLTEINRHTSYTSEFKAVPNEFAYLQSKHEFVPILSRYNLYKNTPSHGTVIAGPILPEKKTYVENELLKTTYQHTGAFGYVFEDNIVYKLTTAKLLPEYLSDTYMNPMEHISDRVINKKNFIELQNKYPYPEAKWDATTLDIQDGDSRMRIFLPAEKVVSGLAALLFEDCHTKKIVPPSFNKYYHNLSGSHDLPSGCTSVIVLYEDGSYLRMDSISLKQNIQVAVDLSDSKLHLADNLSFSWLSNYMWKPDNYVETSVAPAKTRTEIYYMQNLTGNLTGTVYDETNVPMPGVIFQIKGTNYGTVSDLDGSFSLQIDDYVETIRISFIGYKSQEMEVTRGSVLVVQLEPEITALDEIVVVGYGTTTKRELSGAVYGLSIMSARKEAEEAEEPEENPEEKQENSIILEAEQRLYRELLTLNSIRSNFSDVGFWEPRLFTDSKGKSGFRVTFPDDITRWDAVVYAMNKYLQTGTSRKNIRSYKPLMAELNVPQFLTQGDSSLFLGKVMNYTSDSIIQGTVQWSGVKTEMTKNIRFSQYHTDLLPVIATTKDSITTRYSFTRDDSYLDGEERTVPVIEQGIERAEGTLSILKNGDDKNVVASKDEKVTVKILDNQIDFYTQELNYLLNYRYDCNEQLASKLIGLINYKLLKQYEGKPFNHDRDVNRIISRLLKNQNKEFLWSWWDVSNYTSYWMSAHILVSLKCAKDAGYPVNLDIANIARKAEYKFDILKNINLYDIDLLNAIASWGIDMKYSKYIPLLDSLVLTLEQEDIKESLKHPAEYAHPYSYLKEKLLLQEIRQMKGLHYQNDILLKHKKEGMLGDIYFSDNKPSRYWYSDDLSANIVAYRLVKNDSALKHLLEPMQMHFITSRQGEGWNTYQSSGILMNVLPDLLQEGYTKGHTATIKLSGKENKTLTDFPYSIVLNPDEKLHIQKESGVPLFYMQYVTERVIKAKTGIEGFRITSHFSSDKMLQEAGKPIDLIVDVKVEKQSPVEHVMIEVPVPGTCSYADKRQINFGVETHREYFKDKTLIFCEKLAPGKYSFVIHLLPRFTGRYFINPAQVSLMYVPVVNANTDMKQVEVR